MSVADHEPESNEQVAEAAQWLGGKLDKVGDKVDTLVTSVRWSRIREIVLAVVVAFAVFAVAIGTVALVQVRHQSDETKQLAVQNAQLLRCQAVFSAATADRTGVLAPLSQDRQNALTARSDAEVALILTVLTPAPGSTDASRRTAYMGALAALKDAQTAYKDADEAYANASAAHPPPPNPATAC